MSAEPKGVSIRELNDIIESLAAELEARFSRRALSRRLAQSIVMKALRRDDTQAALDEEIRDFWCTAESLDWFEAKCEELRSVVAAVRASGRPPAVAEVAGRE